MKYILYILITIITLGASLVSCDSDDSTYTKSVEGHWIYMDTKMEILVSDSTMKQTIEDYIANRNNIYKVSYEFKNDKTYYYYQNYAEPLKGVYKIIDADWFMMDDSRGIRTVVREDSTIYVVSDLKEEIVRNLDLDPDKIVKVSVKDVFERGLFSE
jgi:hypothetical protein